MLHDTSDCYMQILLTAMVYVMMAACRSHHHITRMFKSIDNNYNYNQQL